VNVTRKKTSSTAKPKTAADRKRAAERSLLTRLQSEHGYVLRHVKGIDRSNPLVSYFKLSVGKMDVLYTVGLCVPLDSELGRAMVESDKKKAAESAARKGAMRARRKAGSLQSRSRSAS